MQDKAGKTWVTPTVAVSDSGNAVWYLPDGMDWHSQDMCPN